ncbi:unnamed protein product [Hymenolepis diminuta]|uniref:C2H2-type domain-containing protein n=2 Tax=Hymenolepis diminuta TaxID=6216 RepID=A0A0R3SCW8_HYMDI|nr:unnamed protein product [Hymenolepis diminuta]
MNELRNYSCDVCNIICNSGEQLRSHESGRSHLKKCMNASSDMCINKPVCYQPLQVSPVSDSDDLETCPMCCNQYSQADFLTHSCECDLIDSISLPPAPFVVIDPSSSTTPLKKQTPAERSEFYCGSCDVSLFSKANYDAHVKGKKHVDNKNKLLIRKAQIEGETNIGLESLSCSLSGIKVIEGSDTSLVGSSLLQQPKDTFSSICSSSVTKAPSSMYCNACDVHLNSTTQMISHVNGKKHQVNLKRSAGQVDAANVSDVKIPQNLLQTTTKSSTPAQKPIISSHLPPNSIMCLVCNVPVGLNDIFHHEKGRAHVYKAAMDGCARINREFPFEYYMFRRQFGPLLPSILSQLPPLPQKLKDDLSVIAEKSEDVVLQLSLENISSISAISLAIAMGIVSGNRQDFEHIFVVWICPQTSTVPNRIMEVRRMVQNFSIKPLLANIQKEAFSLDNTELELTKHDIAFSTPGSLTNLMVAHSNIHRAIPALVLTDVEKCVDNDPLCVLLNRFGAMPIQHRPRIIYITCGQVQNWPLLSTFLVVR